MSNKANVCLVCGSPAKFINYGARTCQADKTYFRRNAFTNLASLKCFEQNKCSSNDSKRKCRACRLRCCLDAGMRPELVKRLKRQRISRSIEPRSEKLTMFEQLEIETITKAWSIFSNEMDPIQAGNEAPRLTNPIEAMDLSLNYIKPAINFINTLQATRELPRAKQLHLLRGFMQHATNVRFAFNYIKDLDAAPVFKNEDCSQVVLVPAGLFDQQMNVNTRERAHKTMMRLTRLLDHDVIIRDLLMLLLMFRPTEHVLECREYFAFHQHRYQYLLRRYLIVKHCRRPPEVAQRMFDDLLSIDDQLVQIRQEMTETIHQQVQTDTLAQITAELLNLV